MEKMQTSKSEIELELTESGPLLELLELEDVGIIVRRLSEKSASNLCEIPSYSDSVFMNAAKLYQKNHAEKPIDQRLVNYGDDPGLAVPNIKNKTSQRWAYELAFNALKYQTILEDIMIDSCLYQSQLINRKFKPRAILDYKEDIIPEVREVENCLHSFKTKLAAALARCRIKRDVLSIDCILPESLRTQQQRASILPLYTWVNILKTSIELVCQTLEQEGFSKVNSLSELNGYSFCQDLHCPNVLIFPAHLNAEFSENDLFTEYKVIMQDKSRSLAPHSVKALMNMDDDIMISNLGSGMTAAHMSTLTNQKTCKVFVCGVKSEIQKLEMNNIFAQMECKNIKLMHEDFIDIDPTDPRIQKVKIILLLPQCSGSGVSNPIEFILKEHGDVGILQDFSQGSIAEDKLNLLVEQQLQDVLHAQKFHKVQAVVYCTCSVYPEENEDIMKKALTYNVEGNKVQPYRICPPVLPLCSASEIMSSADKFFRLKPSEIANGCFLAILTRERDPSGIVSVKDVLARAAAKGLLEGIEMGKSQKREKRKKSKPSIQRTSSNTSGTQAKIAEFLTKEMKKESNANSNVSKPIGRQSSLKILKQTSATVTRRTSKTIPVPPESNVTRRHTIGTILPVHKYSSIMKQQDEKLLPMKPVHIGLPPCPSATKLKMRSPSHSYWNPETSVVRRSLGSIPSVLLKKSKGSYIFDSTRHSRPWH
nr:PREDICTED: putative methyltransferase NSUN7 isoform X2 [Latimeria chalumnae]|eukprot:XP_014346242.1 PREDICTED: putative methyltransferase NSUN7 isoform X2 [Latimeria chalumnae]